MNVDVGDSKCRLVNGECRDLVSTLRSMSHDGRRLVVGDRELSCEVGVGCRFLLHRANFECIAMVRRKRLVGEDEADDELCCLISCHWRRGLWLPYVSIHVSTSYVVLVEARVEV